ncbi:response regulator [bacterium]|jgi:CheY-like chemotaxis protein|nr:response regulator [bacterium]MBT4552239.1 response regulator [bacterium]
MNTEKLVLVVEDEPDLGKIFVRIINKIKDKKKNNYHAIIAENGFEALKLVKKHQRFFGLGPNNIKCICLDQRMPKMDGTQFLKRLKKIEHKNFFLKHIPVVYITAYENEIEQNIATLIKPISKAQLEDTLKEILEK